MGNHISLKNFHNFPWYCLKKCCLFFFRLPNHSAAVVLDKSVINTSSLDVHANNRLEIRFWCCTKRLNYIDQIIKLAQFYISASQSWALPSAKSFKPFRLMWNTVLSYPRMNLETFRILTVLFMRGYVMIKEQFNLSSDNLRKSTGTISL